MLVLTYRGEEAVEEHCKVFEAALARDIDIAAETLKTHIDKGLEHTLAAFQQVDRPRLASVFAVCLQTFRKESV